MACLVVSTSAAAQYFHDVYVGNQGNFSDNNGSVTFFDANAPTPNSTQILEDFGTLVQSLTLHDGTLYIISNTSHNVDIIDLNTLMRESPIAGIPSPRYMAVVAADKAYVSNLYDAQVTVIDLAARTVMGTIPVGTNPEDIAVVGNLAFVANSGFGADSTVTVIDVAADTVVSTIDTGCDGPRHLEVDNEDEVWVFCNGNTVYNDDYTDVLERTNGAVVILDGATGTVKATLPLDSQVGASSAGQDVFFANGSQEMFLVRGSDKLILVFSTATNQYKETIALAGDENVGAVAYDHGRYELYAARLDADNPYTEAGFVTIHGRDGAILRQYATGIAPAHFAMTSGTITATEDPTPSPEGFALVSSFPNPFVGRTSLSFELAAPRTVDLTIVDVLGRVVAQPMHGLMPSGVHQVTWDAKGLAPGTYYARLASGRAVSTRPLILVH